VKLEVKKKKVNSDHQASAEQLPKIQKMRSFFSSPTSKGVIMTEQRTSLLVYTTKVLNYGTKTAPQLSAKT
jgi:hypothetical protein